MFSLEITYGLTEVDDILFDRDTKLEHHSSSLVLRNGIKWLNFILHNDC